MQSRLLLRPLVCALALTMVGSLALGQGFQGTLHATLEDPQDHVLPGVTVKLTNEATGESRTQVSTSAGTVVFSNLLVGQYALEAEQAGFKKFTRQHIGVSANQTVDVAAKLEVGEMSEMVTVTGTELIKTTSSQLEGGNFNARQITDIPVYDPALTGD